MVSHGTASGRVRELAWLVHSRGAGSSKEVDVSALCQHVPSPMATHDGMRTFIKAISKRRAARAELVTRNCSTTKVKPLAQCTMAFHALGNGALRQSLLSLASSQGIVVQRTPRFPPCGNRHQRTADSSGVRCLPQQQAG